MYSCTFLTSLLRPIISEMGLSWSSNTTVDLPRDKNFGDLACNCAMVLAKEAKKNPRELATIIAEKLQHASPSIAKVEIAGPGFLNITFHPHFWQENIIRVDEAKEQFGSSEIGKGQSVQVEFVSANPTGPLHIGHGRGAAVGDSTARVLAFAGYAVGTEYYVNDAGLQMQTLGKSIWLRVQELSGKSLDFPETCYQGAYIKDIAQEMLTATPELTGFTEEEGVHACYVYGKKVILADIKKDLKHFRVHHDNWFSELSLVQDSTVEKTLSLLEKRGFAYHKDGALWFNSTELGDDKDRVLRKSDGSLTYFASDIAYHENKYARGFTNLIDVWGADHHGYVPRVKAAIQSLGRDAATFDVILVQLVNLIKDGEQVAMSTRAGKFETLAQVLDEVGVDAARFIFLSRKSDSKLDFDLDLVKERTMSNPVYYVQYAYARICTLLRRAEERNIHGVDTADISLLTAPEEIDILKDMDRFTQITKDAASQMAPHFISYYLMEFAGLLHKYYSIHHVLDANNEAMSLARLRLLHAAGQIIHNGLNLLGVSAPESM